MSAATRLARTHSVSLVGLEGRLVRVETQVGRGLVQFVIVGLPDASVRESKDRVRSALESCGLEVLDSRVTVNLSPAGLHKSGSGFDLAIAASVLLAAGRVGPTSFDGAVIIGEDLGTVEPWARDYLASRGVLGTSVLWFEKQHDGWPLQPAAYRRLALSTVNTHDLPPTAGYLADEHVALRERLGLLTEPAEQVRAEARLERERMLTRLREHGLLGDDPSEREIVEALHRYVVRTPSALVGVALVDGVGERRAQNQPGTDQEYPNWKIPLADGSGSPVLIEDLPDNVRLASLLAAVRDEMTR